MKHYSTSISARFERFGRSLAPTLVLALAALPALAQTQAVSGQVKDAKGEGLPGVNVILKGTSQGTVTNGEGNYSLAVPANQAGATLVFSFVGYKSQEVAVGEQNTLNVTMGEDRQELEEVVVTALGIKKEARTIGYTTQEIAGSQLVKAREPNPLNSLTGKIAGLTVAPSAELLGRPQIILRGSSEILYVVDGVPVNSDTWNVSADDIETYTVLKGPNAAALYGFRGRNGAIMITTKRGTGDKRRVAVEINSSTQLQTGFVAIPEKQNEYGFGSNYQYAYSNSLYDEGNVNRRANIWGPRFEGQPVPQYDSPVVNGVRQGTPWTARGANNFRDFMRTGVLSTNNISVSSSGDNYDVRLSVSNNYQRGMVPNTGLNITNLNLSTGVHFNTRLKFDGALNLSVQNSPNIPQTSSGPESETYIFQVYGSASWSVNDVRNYYQGPQGIPGVQQYYAEYGRGNNPWFVAYEWLYGHQKTDLYGYGRLDYELAKNLHLAVRSQVTTWNQLRTEKVPYSAITYKTPDIRQGDYREDRRNLLENNTDLLLTYNRDLGKNFTLSALAGASVRLFNYNSSWATTDFLIIPGVYNFSNSKNAVQSYEYMSDMTVLSAYATTDLTWKKVGTLGFTGRVDRSSTLAQAFFYPSVSLSTVINDYLRLPEAISFVKLRGSYANVGSALTASSIGTAYLLTTGSPTSSNNLLGYGTDITTSYDGPTYGNQNSVTITKPYNNLPAAGVSGTLANPNIKPERNSSFEFGFDAKFLGNRLGLDVTRFVSDNGPRIYPLPVASSSAYNALLANAVTTRRAGWEVALTGAVLANPTGLSWDVLANWSTYKETLKEVGYNDETSIYLSGPNHVFNVGDRLDGYYSYNYLRSPDGQVIINGATGIPLVRPTGTNTMQFLGNTNPDWVWSVNNRFSYKNVNFSFQFDGRVGGVIRDQVYAYALNAGNATDLVQGDLGAARLAEWQSTNLGTKAPTPAYVAPGVVVKSGAVQFDANGNISNLSSLEFAPNTKAVTVQSYAQGVYNSGIEEPYMVSKTYAKLREVIIGYTFKFNADRARYIKGLNVSLVGRNLLYFAQRKDFDLDQYGQGFDASSLGTLKNPALQSATVRSFGLNLNASF